MTSKQLQHHIAYIKIAETIGNLSYCKRKQVGSVIVKDNNIISTGYNGSPKGMPNVCEDDNGETNWYTLHSEANCITKLAKSTQSSDGSILYLTLSPCKDCAKLILQAGIKEVYYGNKHSCNEGIAFLSVQGVKCFYLKKEIKNLVEEGGTGSNNYVINTYEKYTCEFFNPLNKSNKDIHNDDWELVNSISDTNILNLHHTNELIFKENYDLKFNDNSKKLTEIINLEKLYVPKIFGQDFLNKLFENFKNKYDIILIESEEYSNNVKDNQFNLFIKGEIGKFHFKKEFKDITNYIKTIFNNNSDLVSNLYLYTDSHDSNKDYISKIPKSIYFKELKDIDKLKSPAGKIIALKNLDDKINKESKLATIEDVKIGTNIKVETAGIYGTINKKETIFIHDCLPDELNLHIENTLGLKYNITFTNNQHDFNNENQLFCVIDNFLHFKTPKYYLNFKHNEQKFKDVSSLIIAWFKQKENNKFEDFELCHIVKQLSLTKSEIIYYLLTKNDILLIKGNNSKSTILIYNILPESLIKSLKKKYDKLGCYNIQVTEKDEDLNNENQLFEAEIFLENNYKIFKFNFKNTIYYQEIKKDIINFYGFHNNEYEGYELKKKFNDNHNFTYYLEYKRLLTINELTNLDIVKDPNKSLLEEIKLEDITNNITNFWKNIPPYFIPNQFGILEKNPYYNNGSTNDNYYIPKFTSSDYPYNINNFPNIFNNLNQPVKNTLIEQKIAIWDYLFPVELKENLKIIFGDIFYFYNNDCFKTNELDQVKNNLYFYFITLDRNVKDYSIYDFNIPDDINNSNKNLIEIRNYIIEYFRDNNNYELFIEDNSPKLKVTPLIKTNNDK